MSRLLEPFRGSTTSCELDDAFALHRSRCVLRDFSLQPLRHKALWELYVLYPCNQAAPIEMMDWRFCRIQP
jgi:hypothetical protein